MKELTVVIPCLHEKSHLETRLKCIKTRLQSSENVVIVVVDAFFDADSFEVCSRLEIVYTATGIARRSVQMNRGAELARDGSALFFLHIDSTAPQDFDELIRQALKQGAQSGCFRLEFDGAGLFLKMFAWFSRFGWAVARGGDQGLFVTSEAFGCVGGFRSDFPVMEDIELCRSLLRRKTFVVLPEKISTSSRKYKRVGTFKLQTVFALMHVYYWVGRPIDEVHGIYRKYVVNAQN